MTFACLTFVARKASITRRRSVDSQAAKDPSTDSFELADVTGRRERDDVIAPVAASGVRCGWGVGGGRGYLRLISEDETERE